MADFGNYTTPDGRTVQFPHALAQNFPGLTPQQDLQPNDLGLMDPTAMEAGAPSSPMPSPAQPPGSGVTLPPPVPVSDAPFPTPPAPQATPQAAPQPATPMPKTDAELSKVGISGALGAQTAAVDKAAEAGARLAETQAQEQRAMADAYAARNAKIVEQETLRQRAAEEKIRKTQAATLEADQATKAYADHKVDRSIDHPVLAAISLGLSSIGSSMAGKPGEIPALNILLQQMDKKVQLQLADRAKLKDVATAKTSAIDRVRLAGDDHVATYNLAMAGETEKAMRKIEEIKARSGSDQVKANADVMLAGLAEKRATLLGGAVERRLALDEQQAQRAQQAKQHAQSLGFSYSQLAETRRHNQATERAAMANVAMEAEKLAASGQAAKAKAIAERGMGGVPEIIKDESGKPVLDKDGNPQLRYGLMKMADGSTWLPDGGENEVRDLRKLKASTDTLVGLLDEAKRLRTGWTSDTARSAEWQQLQANWAAAKGVAKDVLGLGALSGPDMELVDKFIGTSDPTQLRDPEAGISKARGNIVTMASNRFKASGYDQDYKIPEFTKPASQNDMDRMVRGLTSNPADVKSISAMAGTIKQGLERAAAGETPPGLSTGVPPQHQAILDTMGKAVASGAGPERQRAVAALQQVIGNPKTLPAVKSYAQDLLNNVAGADIFQSATPEQTAESTGRSVARDAASKPRPQTKPIKRDSAGNAR